MLLEAIFWGLVAKIWVAGAASENTQIVKPENTFFANCPSLTTRFCKLPIVWANINKNGKQTPGHHISAFCPQKLIDRKAQKTELSQNAN
jgi:hypothetical protein